MTDKQIALARRAVACKGWRWMEGMRAKSPNGMMSCRVSFYDLNRQPHMLPDLTDPATLGCLLALVREAWGDPHASVWYDSEYWQSGNRWAWHAKGQSRVDYDTEAEALVAALEAAP